ncbi:polyprenyl diphosphate synthase [Patescibacteria group bacterium]
MASEVKTTAAAGSPAGGGVTEALTLLQAKAAEQAVDLAIPKHIGIIMDGNRRWAERQSLSRAQGHREGADALERTVTHCAKLGVEVLTVYTFSTENWKKRTKEELKEIFGLLTYCLRNKAKEMKKNGVVLGVVGEINRFPLNIRKLLSRTKEVLKNNNRIKLNLALNYGGRDEILRAFKKIVNKNVSPKEINEELLAQHLDTNGLPEPELIIRTGGRQRLSNFLVWQCTYSELYFTDLLWPDFGPEEIEKAILFYNDCNRNFGK